MNAALKELRQRLSTGLNRASIQSCARWAEEYRVMGSPFPGPWSFKYHPWAREMHDSKASMNVGMKAAQMAFTETALNISFYTIDILKQDVLYVLPNEKPDAANFSASRFDQALDFSPHLAGLFSDVQNVGHKRSGSANLYIRGSQSRTGLKSIPTPKIIFDELEEMNQDNIPLALERGSGQKEIDILVWMLSTPMLHKAGIHKYFLETTQEIFMFKCPCCSRATHLIYPDCLVVCGDDEHDPRVKESYLRCKECKGELPHLTKPDWLANGFWAASLGQREARGFHISQLYSSVVSPAKLAITVHKSLKDPAQEQELWNSKLGLPHEVKGARVLQEELESAKGEYKNFSNTGTGVVCMGVDVGSVLHIEITDYHIDQTKKIDDINTAARAKVLYSGTLEHFEELDGLMQQYGVRVCVIDANPERRKAHEFASRFYGRVYPCFYGNNVKGKLINLNEEAGTITVDRTNWLDTSLSRFRNSTIFIPIDISLDCQEQIKNLVRVYKEDRDGNKIATYVATGPDHFGHARNYCEIALPLAYQSGKSHDIQGSVL